MRRVKTIKLCVCVWIKDELSICYRACLKGLSWSEQRLDAAHNGHRGPRRVVGRPSSVGRHV